MHNDFFDVHGRVSEQVNSKPEHILNLDGVVRERGGELKKVYHVQKVCPGPWICELWGLSRIGDAIRCRCASLQGSRRQVRLVNMSVR